MNAEKIRHCERNSFHKAQRNGDFCDTIIRGRRGINFYAHKYIPSSSCQYFKALSSDSLSALEKHVSISLITDAINNNLIIERADLAELLRLANLLHADHFLQSLVGRIRSTIDAVNCFYWYGIAKQHGLLDLCVLTESYVRTNYDKIVTREGYKHFQDTMDKEVVLYDNSDYETVHLIDIEKKTSDQYDKGACPLINNLLDNHHHPYAISYFTHKNVFYAAIVYYYTIGGISRSLPTHTQITIRKYQQCSKRFETVHEILLDDLISKLNSGSTKDFIKTLPLRQIVYDHLENLYVLFSSRSKVLVLKFNIEGKHIYDSYIEFGTVGKRMKNVFVKGGEHMLLFQGMEDVYNLNKFDFNDVGNHTSDKIKINPDMQSKVDNSTKAVKTLNGTWNVIDLNGKVYLFVVPEKQTTTVSVLALNVEQHFWLHICDLSIPGDLVNVFTCQKKILLLLSSITYDTACVCFDEICTLDDDEKGDTGVHYKKGELYEYICEFDTESKVLTNTGIKLPPAHVYCEPYTVPAHILI